jgi:hypothetical protein
MANKNNIEIEIIVKGAAAAKDIKVFTRNLEEGLKKAKKETTDITAAAEKASTGIGGLSSGFKMLGTVVAGLGLMKVVQKFEEIGRAAAEAVFSVIRMAGKYEMLGITMEVAGKNAGYSAQQMGELEKKLQDTGIAAIESRETLTKMAAAHMDLAKSAELARAAQDLAVVGGINSSEAFARMIYAIQSAQTEMLRTIGLNVSFEKGYKQMAEQLGKTTNQLSEFEKTQSRVNTVLEAAAAYQGIYEKSMTAAEKLLRSLKRHVDNFKVALGAAFQPAYLEVVEKITEVFKKLKEIVSAEALQKGLKEIGLAISGAFSVALGALFEQLEKIKENEKIKSLADGVVNEAVRAIKAIGELAGKIIEELPFFIEKWLPRVQDFLSIIAYVAEIVVKHFDKIKWTVESMSNVADTLIKYMKGFADLVFPSMFSGKEADDAEKAADAADQITKSLSIAEVEAEAAERNFKAMTSAAEDTKDAIEDANKKQGELAQKIQESADYWYNYSGLVQTFNEQGQLTTRWVDSLGRTLSGLDQPLTYIVDGVEKVLDAGNLTAGTFSKLTSSAQETENKTAETANAWQKWEKEMADILGNAGSTEKIYFSISDAITAGGKAQGEWNDIVDTWSTKLDGIKDQYRGILVVQKEIGGVETVPGMKYGGPVLPMQGGGPIPGGWGGGDKVHIMGEPGEEMLDKVTARYARERGILDALRKAAHGGGMGQERGYFRVDFGFPTANIQNVQITADEAGKALMEYIKHGQKTKGIF